MGSPSDSEEFYGFVIEFSFFEEVLKGVTAFCVVGVEVVLEPEGCFFHDVEELSTEVFFFLLFWRV